MTPKLPAVCLLAVTTGCNVIWGVDDLATAEPSASSGASSSVGGSTSSAGGAGSSAGGSGASGGTTGTAAGGQGGSPPVGCDDASDCVDGDPCTVNTCNTLGECASTAVTAGETGTGEAPCVGTCQTDGACGLSLYTRTWPGSNGAFTKTALSVAWTGANAPPPRGILAAEKTHGSGHTIVFSDLAGGTAHMRRNLGWTSAPTATLFAGLSPLAVNSITSYQSTSGASDTLVVSTSGDGTTKLAYYYTLALDGSISADPSNPFVITADSDPDAANQESVDADWELSVQTAFVGTPSWVVFYRSYEASIYIVDGGNFDWTALGPDTSSSLWGATASSGPDAGTTTAAYWDSPTLTLIAP